MFVHTPVNVYGAKNYKMIGKCDETNDVDSEYSPFETRPNTRQCRH